ncbi:MAG: YheU family protein [Steroidobacteraceae bacterium]
MALSGNAAPPRPDASQLTEPLVIPHAELSAEALRGVIESYVLREGTDYGAREYSLEEKVAHVRAQLERGQARILFDPESNTVTLLVAPA